MICCPFPRGGFGFHGGMQKTGIMGAVYHDVAMASMVMVMVMVMVMGMVTVLVYW